MLQYIDSLNEAQIQVEAQSMLSYDYIEKRNAHKYPLVLLIIGYVKRFLFLLKSRDQYDVIWIEKELFSWIPHWIEIPILRWLKSQIILDYDDAIFHNYDQNRNSLVKFLLRNKIKHLMKFANISTCGSPYLLDYAKNIGAHSIFLPTVVPIVNKNFARSNTENIISIGWIGSPYTLKHLKTIEQVLLKLCDDFSNVRISIMGTQNNHFNNHLQFDWVDWSEEVEADWLANIDIGIMPLEDGIWEQGKCGFKLIQYMSMAKPVIASPVGVNIDIVNSEIGYLASTLNDWSHYLTILIENENHRNELGKKGLIKQQQFYSLESNLTILFKLFRNI